MDSTKQFDTDSVEYWKDQAKHYEQKYVYLHLRKYLKLSYY